MPRLAPADLNWSLEGQQITLFNLTGFPMVNGNWVLPLLRNSTARFESPPLSILKVLEDLVRQDIQDGHDDSIDAFGISTVAGLRLGLEGILTKTVLAAGEESSDSVTVTLFIMGRSRKVIIWSPDKELPEGIATYTAAGQTV